MDEHEQAPEPSPNHDLTLIAQRGLVILLLVVIGIASLAMLSSASHAVEIWFRRQWVPVIRLIGSLVVVAVALAAMRMLLQRR